jgi:hypothetical protein
VFAILRAVLGRKEPARRTRPIIRPQQFSAFIARPYPTAAAAHTAGTYPQGRAHAHDGTGEATRPPYPRGGMQCCPRSGPAIPSISADDTSSTAGRKARNVPQAGTNSRDQLKDVSSHRFPRSAATGSQQPADKRASFAWRLPLFHHLVGVSLLCAGTDDLRAEYPTEAAANAITPRMKQVAVLRPPEQRHLGGGDKNKTCILQFISAF